MGIFAGILILLQGIAFIAAVIVIIYLIIRRLSIKEKEDFEHRDN